MPCTLALDPSLANTGFAVLDSTGRVLTSGSIPTNRRLPEQQRLSILANRILALLREHKPADLALERPFVGLNRATALTLGAVRGVLSYLAESHSLRAHEYTTTQVKSAVTSNPIATKTQVQRLIQPITGLTITNNNDSDAIAVGLTHLAFQRAPHEIADLDQRLTDLLTLRKRLKQLLGGWKGRSKAQSFNMAICPHVEQVKFRTDSS